MTERYSVQSNEFDKFFGEASAEILQLKDKITTLSTKEEELKRKNHELMEGWREKGRKLAQTQVYCSPHPGVACVGSQWTPRSYTTS